MRDIVRAVDGTMRFNCSEGSAYNGESLVLRFGRITEVGYGYPG
jgi:hypothetical protein